MNDIANEPRRKRPRSETRRKQRRITYRVSEESYRNILAAASDAKLSVASYSRVRVEDDPTPGGPQLGPVDRAAHKETLRQFTRFAVNFNQLTKRVNMGHVVMPEELIVLAIRIEENRLALMALLRRTR